MLLASTVLASIAAAHAGAVFGKEPVTELESVQRVRFSGELAVSPDGGTVSYVSVAPMLAANAYTWSLVVEPLSGRQPGVSQGRKVYAMDSQSFLNSINPATGHANVPIGAVRWLADNRSVIFKRQKVSDSDAGEICVMDARTGELRVLYSFEGLIREYDVSLDGNTIALYRVHPQDARRKAQMEQNGLPVDKSLHFESLKNRSWQTPLREIVVITGLVSGGEKLEVIERYRNELTQTTSYAPRLSVSPDGRYLVYARRTGNSPEPRENVRSHRRESTGGGALRSLGTRLGQELTIYGTTDRRKRLAFAHPDVIFKTAEWSDDSVWFAVRSPMEPGDTGAHLYAVRAADLLTRLVASAQEVPFSTDPYTGAGTGEILDWREQGRKLTVRTGMTSIREIDFRRGDRWRLGPSVELSMPGKAPYWFANLRVRANAVVALLESGNVAPDLYRWRRDRQHPVAQRLTELNPQLNGLAFGAVEKVSWTNKYGAQSTGYLIVPPDFDPRRQYPAVLMLKDWSDAFIMEGQWYSTGFPAQALASAGMVVLLAAAPDHTREPKVGPGNMGYNFNHMAMVESAIEMLATRRLIDLSKVGIEGFSVTSWQVQFILTNSPFAFAAASTADGWNLNYASYAVQNFHNPAEASSGFIEHLYGGPPFGATLKHWLDYAPAFNADKIRAPVLTEACGLSAPALEWFTALHKLDKPVELYLYPDGHHLLQRPSERAASLRLNLDWFRFWLQGYEGKSPEYDPGRFERWRSLRTPSMHKLTRPGG